MFRAASMPIIRRYLLYNQHWHILCRFDDLLLAGSGRNSMTMQARGRQTCINVPMPVVQQIPSDDGQGGCPKHVELCYQNALEIVHLLVLSKGIYYDSRSYELKKSRDFSQYFTIPERDCCVVDCMYGKSHRTAVYVQTNFGIYVCFCWYHCFVYYNACCLLEVSDAFVKTANKFTYIYKCI